MKNQRELKQAVFALRQTLKAIFRTTKEQIIVDMKCRHFEHALKTANQYDEICGLVTHIELLIQKGQITTVEEVLALITETELADSSV